MKTIKVKKSDIIQNQFPSLKHLENYFGFPAYYEQDGIIELRDNSNYYTTIRIIECKREEAEFNFVNYTSKIHLYYKYAK